MSNIPDKKAFATQVIACLDLTRLSDHDPEALTSLTQRAQTPLGLCAAVCVYPKDLAICQQHTPDPALRFAAVANFPTGDESLVEMCREIELMLAAGADECDLVLPYTAFLAKDYAYCETVLQTCRALFPGTLKVILETGCLQEASVIADAAQCALNAGAEFLKTGTGHVSDPNLLDSVAVLLSVIQKNKLGSIKVSGGVRTTEQAYDYWQLIQRVMGETWMTPNHVRFGASKLLDELLVSV